MKTNARRAATPPIGPTTYRTRPQRRRPVTTKHRRLVRRSEVSSASPSSSAARRVAGEAGTRTAPRRLSKTGGFGCRRSPKRPRGTPEPSRRSASGGTRAPRARARAGWARRTRRRRRARRRSRTPPRSTPRSPARPPVVGAGASRLSPRSRRAHAGAGSRSSYRPPAGVACGASPGDRPSRRARIRVVAERGSTGQGGEREQCERRYERHGVVGVWRERQRRREEHEEARERNERVAHMPTGRERRAKARATRSQNPPAGSRSPATLRPWAARGLRSPAETSSTNACSRCLSAVYLAASAGELHVSCRRSILGQIASARGSSPPSTRYRALDSRPQDLTIACAHTDVCPAAPLGSLRVVPTRRLARP